MVVYTVASDDDISCNGYFNVTVCAGRMGRGIPVVAIGYSIEY